MHKRSGGALAQTNFKDTGARTHLPQPLLALLTSVLHLGLSKETVDQQLGCGMIRTVASKGGDSPSRGNQEVAPHSLPLHSMIHGW